MVVSYGNAAAAIMEPLLGMGSLVAVCSEAFALIWNSLCHVCCEVHGAWVAPAVTCKGMIIRRCALRLMQMDASEFLRRTAIICLEVGPARILTLYSFAKQMKPW